MESLPGYQFEDYLGHGQTKTWSATKDGQRVVVKTLELERVGDWKGIELFEREVATLRQLNHPSIPAFIEFKKDNNDGVQRWHLVQNYVEGVKPTVAFAGAERTEHNLRTFAIHCLTTLKYLQGFSPPLLHRDIKPDNLLVTPNGVAIVDFGSVRHVVPSRVGGSTVAGTSGYMAPEQLMGRADMSSDLYGLGMTIVRIVTGVEPDELPKTRMVVDWRSHAKMRLSEPFAKFVDTLIQPHPESRFGSAEEALQRMNDTGPPPSLVPETPSTLELWEGPDGALHAQSYGLAASWYAPVTLVLMIILAFILAPIVLLISPFIAWWFASNSTNTKVKFDQGMADVETGWVFKKRERIPAKAFVGISDTMRRRGALYAHNTKVSGTLTYRERTILRETLEYRAVSHIDTNADAPVSLDFGAQSNETETAEQSQTEHAEATHGR